MFTHSGPQPFLLPLTVPFWAAIGGLYGEVAKVSPKMCALILAVSKIADVIVFACAAIFSGITGIGARARICHVYAITNAVVNAATIIAMYRLNLIAETGVAVLTGLSMLYYIVNYVPTAFNDDEEHLKLLMGKFK